MNVSERPLSAGDLLRAVLVDHVAVGHLQRVGVAEVDLVLAVPGLALRELDGTPALSMPLRICADEVLVAGRLEDVVVLDHSRECGVRSANRFAAASS